MNAIIVLEIFEIDLKKGWLMNYCDKFKALSDSIRLDILDELKNGELSAGDIASKFSLPNSKVSYHLSILKKAGMVSERKYKNYIFYNLNLKGVNETLNWLERFRE